MFHEQVYINIRVIVWDVERCVISYSIFNEYPQGDFLFIKRITVVEKSTHKLKSLHENLIF
jgi:hypothetical protein